MTLGLAIFATNFGERLLQTTAKAVAQGGLYALVALGFVLIFKATQTVNFAQGAIALMGAWFASLLLINWNIPGRWMPATVSIKLLWALGAGVLLTAAVAAVLFSAKAMSAAVTAVALIATFVVSVLLLNWLLPYRDAVGSKYINWLLPNRGDVGTKYINWVLAIIIAALLTAVLGLVLERTIIRPMIGKPLFSVAVITLGAEAVLRSIGSDAVSVDNRSLAIPWGDAGFYIGDAFVGYTYVAIYIATLLAFVAIYFFFKSKLGIAMRAVAFDQEASLAQGISVGRVFAIAWAVSAFLACIAGVLSSGSPLSSGLVTVGITGLAFRALPAVILGGLDSVVGALIGGLAIGAAEVFSGEYLAPYTSFLGVGYQLVVPYLVMLAVLLIRPYGLFGTPEIRRV